MALASAFLGLALAACGDGSTSPTGAATTAAVEAGGSSTEAGSSSDGESGGGESGGDQSGGDQSSGPGEPTTGSAPQPENGSGAAAGSSVGSDDPTASFIRQGEAICEAAKKAQIDGVSGLAGKQGGSASRQERIEAVVLEAALPPIKRATEELAELKPPDEISAEFDAIVRGLEEAIEAAEAKPFSLLKVSQDGPFAEVDAMATEFGFKTCAGLA